MRKVKHFARNFGKYESSTSKLPFSKDLTNRSRSKEIKRQGAPLLILQKKLRGAVT